MPVMTRLSPLRPFATVAILLTALGSSGCAARGAAGISNVVPLPVHEGTSIIARFAPDGRQAVVVEARMPGAATPSLMALLPREGGWHRSDGWDVVGMPRIADAADGASATFDPHGGAAVFARAKIRGMPATLLLAAVPAETDPQPLGRPRRMDLLTYRLDTGASSAGFSLLDRRTSSIRYCNAADAISDQYAIAVPAASLLCQRTS